MRFHPLPHSRKLSWASPLAYAASIAAHEPCWALLYSGLHTATSGQFSFLFLHPREQRIGGWEALESIHAGRWVGYLGYGLKNTLENLPEDRADNELSPASVLPDLCLTRYGVVLVFDHTAQTLEAFADEEDFSISLPSDIPTPPAPTITHLTSPMTKAEYLAHVETLQKSIAAGDVYQANLTRKFTGTLAEPFHPFDIFCRLVEASPAPYSAYIKQGNTHLLSSSPEQFLKISADGQIETRPIKGTAPRGASLEEDEYIAQNLRKSAKDRAENLMIVDLLRNDLARVCTPGSVAVENLFAVERYATLHHMVSTILGQRRADCTTTDVLKACFPPGSMTGAPKIRAMQLCSQLEKLRRGVYSGALGWLDAEGACDFSVVIRTLIIIGNRFEFQVGGGIVADSTPESEWRETLTKARGIAKALGISEGALQNL